MLSRYASVVALVGAALGNCPIAYAQTPHSCGMIDSLGIEADKPFTAERLTHSVMADGSERTLEFVEFVARDATGGIRVEKHPPVGDAHGADEMTLNTHEGGTITTTHDMLQVSVIIFDCPKGETVIIQPGMQIAQVKESGVVSKVRLGSRPYSSFFNTLAGRDLPPTMAFEDLGTKEIEGISARGFKSITLGAEKDGIRCTVA